MGTGVMGRDAGAVRSAAVPDVAARASPRSPRLRPRAPRCASTARCPTPRRRMIGIAGGGLPRARAHGGRGRVALRRARGRRVHRSVAGARGVAVCPPDAALFILRGQRCAPCSNWAALARSSSARDAKPLRSGGAGCAPRQLVAALPALRGMARASCRSCPETSARRTTQQVVLPRGSPSWIAGAARSPLPVDPPPDEGRLPRDCRRRHVRHRRPAARG